MKNTFPFLLLLLLLACRKERTTTDSSVLLTTSTDTLHFDTLFTTVGSITQGFKIFNSANENIQITSIRLTGGAASAFKINVNGTPGPVIENLELAAHDSAYVFVSAKVPQTAATAPFIVQDSIQIIYNGNTRKVQLRAYGQNAHFLRNYTVTGNEIWEADLPYVVQGPLAVAEGGHLTLAQGCRIYAHADASFLIAGQLTVQGDHWESTRVVFSGDRLDASYRDIPGSWPGLIFKATSHDNSIRYGVLKNAVQAIAVEASPLSNKLSLHETIISNASDAGLIATNAHITARNILISNCSRNLVLQGGGTYTFTHATIASFSTSYLPHRNPVVTLSNAAGTSANSLNAVFRNCIFWGENNGLVPEEVVLTKAGNTDVQVLFDGVLWPLFAVPENATVSGEPVTADPEFVATSSESEFCDFHVKETSPARNRGMASNVSLDLDGRPRPVDAPDLGAYEEQ